MKLSRAFQVVSTCSNQSSNLCNGRDPSQSPLSVLVLVCSLVHDDLNFLRSVRSGLMVRLEHLKPSINEEKSSYKGQLLQINHKIQMKTLLHVKNFTPQK